MKAKFGSAIYTEFGFLDSFNPTLLARDGPLRHGRIVPDLGWVDEDYLGIDQGPIVIMTENHRSDFVWRMRREAAAPKPIPAIETEPGVGYRLKI
jgi:hypothetical protein